MKRKNDFLQGSWGANIFILLLIGIAIWAAYNLLSTGEDRVQPRVSVLVEDSKNERWTAFRLGLDKAADEYGADVTFITSTGFESAEDQKNLISQEAAAGTEGLILSLYDSEETDIVSGAMKLVFVETDGIRDSSAGTAAVVPSGMQMGKALGEMMLEDSRQSFSGEDPGESALAGSGSEAGEIIPADNGKAPAVAILTGNLRRYSQKEMLQGLTQVIQSAGGTVLTLTTEEEELPAVMEQAGHCDMIAVLEDSLLVQAAAIADSEDLGEGRLYGIGCSPSNISYLDRGVISGMVVPNEFSMGYQSLAQLSKCLTNDIPVMSDIEVGFTSVRTDEVHTKANEKLLFLPIQ